MATPSATLQTLIDMEFKVGALRKALMDNQVALTKTTSAALKAQVDALDTTLQALTQAVGNDCNTLS